MQGLGLTVPNEKLTPWSRVLLENLSVPQLVKKFRTFYGTRMFIIVFTRASHWSVKWKKDITTN